MNVTNDKNAITLAHEIPSHGKKTQHHPPAGPNMPQPTQQIPPKSSIIKTDKPRPHICLTCTRSFARLEHLKRHERSHTKEKPFQCTVCERCFARRDLLLRHKQKLHASFPETPKVRATAKRKSVSAKSGSKAVAGSATAASGAPPTVAKQTALPSNPSSISKNLKNINNNNESNNHNNNNKNNINGNNGMNIHTLKSAPGDFSAAISPANSSNGNNFSQFGDANPFLDKSNTTNPAFDAEQAKVARARRMRPASFSAASSTSYSTYKDIALMDAPPDGPSQVGFATPQLLPVNIDIDQDMPIDDLFNSSNSLFINPQLLDNFEENFFLEENNGLTKDASPMDTSHFKSYSSTTIDSARNNSIRSTTNQSSHSFEGSLSPNMKPPVTGAEEDFPWLDSIKADIPDPVNLNPSFLQNDGSPIQVLETLTGPLQSFQKQSQQNSPYQQSPYNMQESFNHNSNSISPFFNDQTSSTNINGSSINTNAGSNSSSEVYSSFNNNSNNNNNNNNRDSNNNTAFANNFHDTPDISTEMDFSSTLWDNYQTAMFPNNNRQNFQFEVKPHQITPTLRAHIISTLSTPTPFTSTQHPHLPSTPELQTYIDAYITNFAPHLPFLHQTLEFTPENAPLALSMAAIGALHVFERADSASIFEISRCCVHVYLESRRERKLDSKHGGQSEVTPLWLVQALLLGVIYGLFNDEPLANEIAVAQANAVISLAKSAGLHMPPRGFVSIPDANNSTIEDKWHYFVSVQERIRTMHVVHIVSCLLATGYNVVVSLKNGEIRCGSPCDEDLWSALNAHDWWAVLTKKESEGSLGNAIEGPDFSDCLTRLISGNTLVGEIPQFTLLTLIYAIHLEIHERRLDYDRLNTQAISPFGTDDQTRMEFNDHDGSASPGEIQDAKWLEIEKRRIEAMLRAWETTWSLSPHASLIPRSQEGSLMSDSIPMSSLAHVRLYLDLRKAKEYFWKRDFANMGRELDVLSAPVLYELQSGTRKQFNALLEAASYAADTISLWEKHSARWTLRTTASQTFIHNILALFDCGLIVSEFFNRLEKRGDANTWHEDEKQLVSRLRKIFFRVFDVLSSRYMDDTTDVLHNQQERVSTPSQQNGGGGGSSSSGSNGNFNADLFLQKDLQLPLSLMSLGAVSRILSTIFIWPFAVVMAQALKARMGQIREAKMRLVY